MNSHPDKKVPEHSRFPGFRRTVLRGLGVILPPLLTIAVLIWAWTTIESYVLRPVENLIRTRLVLAIQDSPSSRPADAEAAGDRKEDGFIDHGKLYVPDPTGRRFIPEEVKKTVDENADVFEPNTPAPANARAYWNRYVELKFMSRRWVVPVFLIIFLTAAYFLGRLFTFGIGRWVVRGFDAAILRIPVVNKVYGSVKQVTDFVFSEREIEFNRVVAIQYPREGIWSLGFVTGNSMREISEATGEPMLSVLMPTSPMPMTGFTVTVKKSEAIDLNLTIDEAIQFVVSCGVVIPPQQRVQQAVNSIAPAEIGAAAITTANKTSGPSATAGA
jgi:uncharacterized membrane protein